MYRKIKEAPLLFPQHLSNDLKDLITKLLNRDPKERLGSPKENGEPGVESIKNIVFLIILIGINY